MDVRHQGDVDALLDGAYRVGGCLVRNGHPDDLAPGPLRILAEGRERTGWASAGILHVAREETAALLDSFEWDAER